MSFQVQKIDHINVVVSNLDEGIALWRDLTGLEPYPAEDHESLGYRSADFILPDGNNLSLMTPLDNDMGKVIQGFIDKRGEGLYILSLAVQDPEAVADELSKQDLRMIPLQGMAFVHPKSSNGVSVEYIKPGVTAKEPSKPASGGGTHRVVSLNHVGVVVESLEDATPRWEKMLGGVKPQSTGEHPDLGYRGAFATLPNGGVDLIEPLVKDDSNHQYRTLKEGGEGFYLLALDVDNVQACADALNAKGWRVNVTGPGIAFVGKKSSRGVLLELVEKEK